MNKIYFSSDHHFYHANIIKLCNRPFSSVVEMNETMIRLWNETVDPDDIVYYLGDFSLAFRPVELYTHRLNGYKTLIPGNHDFCHSYNKKSRSEEDRYEWIRKYLDLGWDVGSEDTLRILDGTEFVTRLCHFPYGKENSSDSSEIDKYENWRPTTRVEELPKIESLLLCGHVHNKWKIKGDMVNVGVDVWDFKPVSLETILELVKQPSVSGT